MIPKAITAILLLALTSCGSPRVEEIATKSGVVMVRVPAGEFLMGSDRGNPDEQPVHKVRMTGFLMDKYEVTHAMFAKAQLPDPSHWQDDPQKPVERVRWCDAVRYCNTRSRLEGLTPCYNEDSTEGTCDFTANGYRLPTEAEWEYACRAGAGDVENLRQSAWFADNADAKPHPVGQKRPNRWGLCDMLGNVAEWCEDVYSPDSYRQSPAADPRGPASSGENSNRVLRGGWWKSRADGCRPTVRRGEPTGNTDACFSTEYTGFRCVRRE